MADRRIYELATKSAALGANDYFAVDNGTEAESKKLPTSYFTDQLADMQNVYGAKNLIPYPYYRPSGYTSGNMTGTYDANGVITINKTADTTTRYFALYNGEPFLLPNTTYTLSLELTNATNTSVYMADGVGAGLDMAAIRNKATGKYDVTFTTPSTFNDNLIIGLYYGKDIVETNAIVKVMLRLASIQDDTWVPYAKTNKELTDNLKVKTIEFTSQASTNDGKLILTGMGHKMAIVSSRLLDDSNNHLIVPFGFCYSTNGDALFMLADNSDNTIISSAITISGTIAYLDLS